MTDARQGVTSRAFAVLIKDLHLWSVGSHFRIDWQWAPVHIKPLSVALRRKQIGVDKDSTHDNLPLVTLHFDGTMEPRNSAKSSESKGRLYSARAGDVIYSKIDARNGAIGVVPDELPQIAVSSEYPVYEVLPDVALPQFIQLLFRTRYFQQIINSMVSGASGRKRVQPTQIETVEVPLPPIAMQQAIVEQWRSAQKAVHTEKAEIGRLEAELMARFVGDLGLSAPANVTRPKTFTASWNDLLRWSVSFNQTVRSGADLSVGKYSVVELSDILERVQYGTSEKANAIGVGTPILRINNIKDRTIDLSELKHIQLPTEVKQRFLLDPGDILLIRTSGSRDLVGTSAVFRERCEYVYASYLLRLRVRGEAADPDFVSWFINSPFGRQQVDALSRHIMQNNINSEEIRSLQIPLPSVTEQRAIMRRVKEELSIVRSRRENIRGRAREAENLVEDLILGTRELSA